MFICKSTGKPRRILRRVDLGLELTRGATPKVVIKRTARKLRKDTQRECLMDRKGSPISSLTTREDLLEFQATRAHHGPKYHLVLSGGAVLWSKEISQKIPTRERSRHSNLESIKDLWRQKNCQRLQSLHPRRSNLRPFERKLTQTLEITLNSQNKI